MIMKLKQPAYMSLFTQPSFCSLYRNRRQTPLRALFTLSISLALCFITISSAYAQSDDLQKSKHSPSQEQDAQNIPYAAFGEDPLAVYLSWIHDPATTMIIRWITQEPSEEDDIIDKVYHEDEQEKPVRAFYTQRRLFLRKCAPQPIPEEQHPSPSSEWVSHIATTVSLPENSPYHLHSVYCQGLEPNSLYHFRIGNSSVEHTFQTAPQTLDTPIRFVIGGDTHQSERYFIETTREAARSCPLFAVLGGDLAYATPDRKSKLEDSTRWISWLRAWYKEMQCPSPQPLPSRIVPLIVAIGNHEVKGRFGQTEVQAPFFYTLFRKPYHMKSYYNLRFGDYLSLYILDTGHTAAIHGEQKQWLSEEMQKDALVYHKIAAYHVPAYPSVRYYRNTMSAQVRRHWIPIFDKERLHLAFEHHDHAYKRTFPLKENTLHPRGVVYIGDGSWGTRERTPKKANRTAYLAKTVKARQFCQVTLSYDTREVTALTSKGEEIDHYSEEIDDILAKRQATKSSFPHEEAVSL